MVSDAAFCYPILLLPMYQWPHGNSCTWSYDVRLHIASTNELKNAQTRKVINLVQLVTFNLYAQVCYLTWGDWQIVITGETYNLFFLTMCTASTRWLVGITLGSTFYMGSKNLSSKWILHYIRYTYDVATDKCNGQNEIWRWTNNDIEVAVQSWLWVRVEFMAW